jgi:hypothetical protein
MKRNTLQYLRLVFVIVAAGLLLAPTPSMAQSFSPNQAFLLGINIDESAAFGGSGHLISVTADGANAVDYTFMYGTTGDTKVAIDATFFGPNLNLSAYTRTDVNTEVLSGSATVQLFVQGNSPAFAFDTATGPGGQTAASGVLPLGLAFTDPNFTPGSVIRYGLQFFGNADQTATVRISTIVPEPSLLALCAMGLVSGLMFLRGLKA